MDRSANPFERDFSGTPCIGICSTTYGDLVCRGCKRYSHEIVRWNALQESQREFVWRRLHRLRCESILACVRVVDSMKLIDASRHLVDEADAVIEHRIYEVLTKTSMHLVDCGLALIDMPENTDRIEVLNAIDDEFFSRSCMYYQYSYKRSPW